MEAGGQIRPVNQFIDIKPHGYDYIYKSCNNCGTVDLVHKDAEQHNPSVIYFTPPWEVRKCTGCNYRWAWK